MHKCADAMQCDITLQLSWLATSSLQLSWYANPKLRASVADITIDCAALEQFWVDLQRRIAGKPDIFQSAYDDALRPLTRNNSKLLSALDKAEAVTAQQQAIITTGVLTKRRTLERFTCCTNQPPFRISAQGYWTQDTRLPSNASAFVQQLGFSQPDEGSNRPSIWQRVFGTRTLLAAMSSAASRHSYSAWRLQQGGSPQLPRSASASRPAQHGSLNLNETARPLLRRQNAFRLNEREADRLSQQLGLSQRPDRVSGHELLGTADSQSDLDAGHELKPERSTLAMDSLELQAMSTDAQNLDKEAKVEVLAAAHVRAKDIHHSFNATAAYANITRCNPQRWVHLHGQGVLAEIV